MLLIGIGNGLFGIFSSLGPLSIIDSIGKLFTGLLLWSYFSAPLLIGSILVLHYIGYKYLKKTIVPEGIKNKIIETAKTMEQSSNKEKIEKLIQQEDEEVSNALNNYAPVLPLLGKYIVKMHHNHVYSSFEHINRLRELLETKLNRAITDEELRDLLEKASKKYLVDLNLSVFKKFTTLEQVIEKYVQDIGENSSNPANIDLLRRTTLRKFLIDYSETELTEKVNAKLKEIELEQFEKNIEADDLTSFQDIDQMEGLEFERWLGELFKRQGYKVQNTPGSNDYGADLILEKFGKKIVIQAKRYNGTVPNSAIQEAHTAKQYFDCDEAWIVTQSKLSRNSIAMAQKLKVKVIDRQGLEKMM